MAAKSKIEWTHTTWNPVTGCDKVSAGCDHCYADRMSKRLKAMGVYKYRNGFDLTIHPDVLDAPSKWTTPQIVFVNSMSDLFHEKVPFEFLQEIFKVMEHYPQHTFQVLTKRSKQLIRLGEKLNWSDNVWMGVTVENKHYRYRIKDLKKTGAKVKFLSLEPLIGPLPDMDLTEIDWAIVGGESGPGARPMKEEWVWEIKKQCDKQDVSFFFKQWGGVNKKRTGRILGNRTWDEMPNKNPFAKDQLSLTTNFSV